MHNPLDVKLLTRLRLKFSRLNEHKFRHNFKHWVSPICDCGAETKTTSHFFCVANLLQMKDKSPTIIFMG